MNKHDNIYNILNKLSALEPPAPKQESMLKQLNESSSAKSAAPSLAERLTQRYQEAKQLNEYFHFDMPKGKDRGPRDTGTDELERRSKLGKDPLIKHGADYKTKDQYGSGYKIAGPKGALPESEQRSMSRAAKGNEKYGKDGMKELAKAGRDGASEQELDKIRAKHNKYDESVEVDEDMLAKKDYDGDGKKESGKAEYMGSRDKAIKKAMGKSKEEGNEFSGELAGMQSEAGGYAPNDHPQSKDYGTGDDDAVPGKSWIKDPSDPASKVPAYQRKANEPGRRAAQDSADASNEKVGAKVFRSGRPAPMEEAQYDENDAHSSLPGMRKTSDKEHSEYDAAAHTIRKWMRKRGWNTNKEFKSALKYIMDNLDDKHDDSLTHKVKEAAKICKKHHATMIEAGLDMNLIQKAQGAMRGVNTDPESERNRGKPYGYRSDAAQDSDDDYDEWGNLKKGAKKSASAPSDAPKKKGRPRKNFGPERVTAKAYKHKGERKTNEGRAIDLEHYVEDTMAELEAMFIVEKAKSKSQQRFFGMVHAAQKGDEPASKEVEKAAKGMSKKDAKDFAKTKHKGLPNKVSEGINYAEMMRETDQTVEEMLNELHGEMDEYKRTGYLGDKLRDALDIHRHSKKLMDNEIPNLVEVPPESAEAVSVIPAAPPTVDTTPIKPTIPNPKAGLRELAKLAGIKPIEEEPNESNEFIGARRDAIRAGKETFTVGGKTYTVTGDKDEKVNEGGCNITAEGQYCPEHGMNECGMAEGKGKSMEESANLDECGDMSPMGSMDQQDGMSVNTSMDTKTGRKTVTVTADGDAAEELAKILKMAGMIGAAHQEKPKVISIDNNLEEYANEPDERYAGVDAITRAGNDLNRPKKQDPGTANRAANPLDETAVQEDKLFKLYKSLKDIV